MRSQFVTSSWGGRRYSPFAFTEQGAAARRSTPEDFDKLVHEEIKTRSRVWNLAGVNAE